MFSLAYLLAALLAAVPLGFTLLQAQAGKTISLHRIYSDLLRIGAVILGIIVLEIAFRIALQNYWFGELGQQYRYWLALGLRTGIFAAVFVAAGAFVGGNLSALSQGLPGVPRSAPWLAGFLFSAVVAYGAIEL